MSQAGSSYHSQCYLIFTALKRSLRSLCFYTCLSVILFTEGSVCLSACWDTHTPPPQNRPSPLEQTPPPPSAHPRSTQPPWSRPPLEQTSPVADTPVADTSPQSRPPGADTPQEHTPAPCGHQAGGTHPTGMHTCHPSLHPKLSIHIKKLPGHPAQNL